MSRGKKLNLSIGADFGDDGWSQVEEKSTKVSNEILEPQKHQLVFKREKRRGKVVTLVGPFALSKEDASSVLKTLKKRLGSGGSFKAPWMEFQGECQASLRPLLENESFRFKKKS